MAVPSFARQLSKTQYLYETFKLNIRLGQIVMSKPKKYRENYGDRIINNALDALKFCQAANGIFMSEKTSEADYLKRRNYLLNALALIDNVSTVSDIFLTLNFNLDGAKKEQIERQEEYIGSTCRHIHILIRGVLDSDSKIFKGEKTTKQPRSPQNIVRGKM
jgi:hypothetical protein